MDKMGNLLGIRMQTAGLLELTPQYIGQQLELVLSSNKTNSLLRNESKITYSCRTTTAQNRPRLACVHKLHLTTYQKCKKLQNYYQIRIPHLSFITITIRSVKLLKSAKKFILTMKIHLVCQTLLW